MRCCRVFAPFGALLCCVSLLVALASGSFNLCSVLLQVRRGNTAGSKTTAAISRSLSNRKCPGRSRVQLPMHRGARGAESCLSSKPRSERLSLLLRQHTQVDRCFDRLTDLRKPPRFLFHLVILSRVMQNHPSSPPRATTHGSALTTDMKGLILRTSEAEFWSDWSTQSFWCTQTVDARTRECEQLSARSRALRTLFSARHSGEFLTVHHDPQRNHLFQSAEAQVCFRWRLGLPLCSDPLFAAPLATVPDILQGSPLVQGFTGIYGRHNSPGHSRKLPSGFWFSGQTTGPLPALPLVEQSRVESA